MENKLIYKDNKTKEITTYECDIMKSELDNNYVKFQIKVPSDKLLHDIKKRERIIRFQTQDTLFKYCIISSIDGDVCNIFCGNKQ